VLLAACAAGRSFALGTAGAGSGALAAGLKGGLGSASTRLSDGTTVGALVAANPTGAVTVADTRHFWAAPFEIGDEFGGLGLPAPMPADSTRLSIKYREMAQAGLNTTLAVVATDVELTKAQAKRLAVMAQAGLTRAIHPVHTPLDGDVVFAVSTGRRPLADPVLGLTVLGSLAADCLARAVARGVYEATALPFPDALPAWRDRFGG